MKKAAPTRASAFHRCGSSSIWLIASSSWCRDVGVRSPVTLTRQRPKETVGHERESTRRQIVAAPNQSVAIAIDLWYRLAGGAGDGRDHDSG